MCSKPTNVFLFKRFVSPVQICCRSIKGGGLVHPVTGKNPPTLEEFDPLNPGEWQLGAYGKILPRLPEGTRCGGLVMGKYGLYNPKVRALQEECYPKMMADGARQPKPGEHLPNVQVDGDPVRVHLCAQLCHDVVRDQGEAVVALHAIHGEE